MREGQLEPAGDFLAEAAAADTEIALPSQSGRRLKQIARQPRTIAVGLALAMLIFLALFGGAITPYNATLPDPIHEFLAPSLAHPMGTDDLGRDVLTRVMAGTRYSLEAVVIVLTLALLAGTVVGSVAGYAGGMVDEILMRFTDIVLAFPGIILALALAAALGPSLINATLAIAAIWWPTYARLVRGQVLSTKENLYVEAARAFGLSPSRIVRRHILPNSFAPVLVQLSLDMGDVLVTVAALSFIGLGAQLPTPEWGLMVSTDAPNVLTAWWQSTFPGLAIFVTALIFNLGGDLLQEIFLRDARSAV